MRRGAILHWKNFTFSDGSSKSKFAICIGLNETANTGLFALATSQQKGKSDQLGCHKTEWPHNFLLPPRIAPFTKKTWILPDQFYEVRLGEILQKSTRGEVADEGNLPADVSRNLRGCASMSDDMKVSWNKMLGLGESPS